MIELAIAVNDHSSGCEAVVALLTEAVDIEEKEPRHQGSLTHANALFYLGCVNGRRDASGRKSGRELIKRALTIQEVRDRNSNGAHKACGHRNWHPGRWRPP